MLQLARPVVFRLATALGAISVAACAFTGPSSRAVAREGAAAEWNCPDEQISAEHRPDLRPLPTPPSDVAADPQRLAQWKAQTASEIASEPASADHPTIVQVAGCGHQQFYECYHWASGSEWVGRRYGGWVGTTTTSCNYIAPPGLGAVGTASAEVAVDRIGQTRAAHAADCPLQLLLKAATVAPTEILVGRLFVVADPNTDSTSDSIKQLVHPQACALGGDLINAWGGIVLTTADGVPYKTIEFDVYVTPPQSF